MECGGQEPAPGLTDTSSLARNVDLSGGGGVRTLERPVTSNGMSKVVFRSEQGAARRMRRGWAFLNVEIRAADADRSAQDWSGGSIPS
jgi:hypothetical protein